MTTGTPQGPGGPPGAGPKGSALDKFSARDLIIIVAALATLGGGGAFWGLSGGSTPAAAPTSVTVAPASVVTGPTSCAALEKRIQSLEGRVRNLDTRLLPLLVTTVTLLEGRDHAPAAPTPGPR